MKDALENLSKKELLEIISKQHLEASELAKEIIRQNNVLVKSEKEVSRLTSKVSQMQYFIDQLKRLAFGTKKERFIPKDENQQSLPFSVEEKKDEFSEETVISYTKKKQKRENHKGRVQLPLHLPVEEIILEPNEDVSGMKKIGEEVTDKLELTPAKLYIKRYIRPKYIKQEDENTSTYIGVIAPLPSFAIDKGVAGSGLLTQIIIDKFVDHLPIYRQIERFKRDQVKISASTINGWQDAVSHLLEPLYDTLKKHVLAEGYLQVDETPLQVLDKNKKGKTHRGYHWVYHAPLQKSVIFDYRDGRGREGPETLLKNFKGYLQTDGYKVYDAFGERDEITLLNCMAHARRGFEKALDYDKVNAEYALKLFQELYKVERKAKDLELNRKERKELRLKEALPIANELGKWLAKTYKKVLPKSAIGKAIAYCVPRWDNLIAYMYDGALEIDNNLAENAIRPIALGRKNYLFAGSSSGAKRAAMFYSFFATCKKNDVNPFEWLKKVLDVIPDHKVSRLHELLPQNLKLD